MLFKNAIAYTLHTELAGISSAILEPQRARPLHGQDPRRMGWMAPCGTEGGELVRTLSAGGRHHTLISALRQERMLPAHVVNGAVKRRVAELEKVRGTKIGRAEKQGIKEDVVGELLPKAFIKEQRIDAWIDHGASRIVVNATSRKPAEELLDLLRESLGSLKITPLATQALPARTMTEWVRGEAQLPASIHPTDHVVLEAKGDDGTVTGRKVDLSADDIQASLASGRIVRRLGVSLEGVATFTLADDLAMRGVKFADQLLEESAAGEYECATQRMDADFLLMADALSGGIDTLMAAFGGPVATPAAA